MANIYDFAKYITGKVECNHTKLQKLLYFCKAWGFYWTHKHLLNYDLQAWENGPVFVELYGDLKYNFNIKHDSIVSSDLLEGNVSNLTILEQKIIDSVLKELGDKESGYLTKLSHGDQAWYLGFNKHIEDGKEGKSVERITNEDIELSYAT